MPLPASFLSQVEHHGCFSGCYGSELDARVCLDPAQAPDPAVFISCRDCLTYKIGVLRALLPPGTSADILADQVTQHLRAIRGFDLSFGGYHMRAGGFWLNAVYYATCGVFLVDGSRSRATGSDLDLLLLAFRHGVIQAPDPRMTDPQLYTTQIVYVDFSLPVQPVKAKQDLLSSSQCRQHPASGFHRVTLAEFLPVSLAAATTAPAAAPAAAAAAPGGAGAVGVTGATGPTGAAPGAGTATPTSATMPGGISSLHGRPPRGAGNLGLGMGATGPHGSSGATATRPLRAGDICPVCKAEVRERPLFNGTYVGCLC